MNWTRIFVLLLFLAGGPRFAYPAETTLKVGAASCDITPDLNLSNWITHKSYAERLEPICVRAVVLGGSEKRVAIVSWELLYPMESAVARARAEIEKVTGIEQSRIMICATHNHSAPWSPIFSDPLTSSERKVLDSTLSDTNYPAWAEKVIKLTAEAVHEADASKRLANISIARAYAGDVLYNRRPIKADGSVQSLTTASDPYVMGKALRFGRVDPTLTLLVARDASGAVVASLSHLACHAVVVYPAYNGISGDWPGAFCSLVAKNLGGEAIFLQGCAGDVNPVRRGIEARDWIAGVISERAIKAAKVAEPLNLPGELSVRRKVLVAPVLEKIRADIGRDTLPAEVQAITCGDLAIVSLPGEPLGALAAQILDQSPFPHTVVLGYANGYGVQYVGLPGDKAKGGYEMGSRSLGADECGGLLVQAAIQLLKEARGN